MHMYALSRVLCSLSLMDRFINLLECLATYECLVRVMSQGLPTVLPRETKHQIRTSCALVALADSAAKSLPTFAMCNTLKVPDGKRLLNGLVAIVWSDA